MQKGKNTGHVRLNKKQETQARQGYVYLIFSRSWIIQHVRNNLWEKTEDVTSICCQCQDRKK